ncbi:sure-like protein [Tricholoma matsutake]|nr:sure-like protein [Tricholoma matsutake 945]
MAPPTVLLTNDDGPPDSVESPYVFGFYCHLTEQLGWNVKVVLPASQKSWIGKAYHIKEVTKGSYFYPRENGQGEISTLARPLKDGEVAEWILLDGTPATCVNVALHNLFSGQIDLVLSGPNLGRNTSSAFALSSGTIGAALSSSLSTIRSIAVSYGTVHHPTPATFFEPAHVLGCRIVQHLWSNWGEDEAGLRNGEVDLYSINIPLVEGLLSEQRLKICWTTMWRNSYGRLFKKVCGPDLPKPKGTIGSAESDPLIDRDMTTQHNSTVVVQQRSTELMFKFAPDMAGLITPTVSTLPMGSDAWAIHQGWVSVTPLRAGFGEPPGQDTKRIEDRLWNFKL